jgi:hypothetical protein
LLCGLWLGLAARAGGDPHQLPEKIAPPSRIPDPASDPLQPRGVPVATAAMPREVRRAVVADAARRFEVAESAVVLSAAEQVSWSDGSLGCPEPGRMYTQALVPGYRVTATTPMGRMRYHTDSRGQVVTCAQPRPRASSPGAGVEPRTQPLRPPPDR